MFSFTSKLNKKELESRIAVAPAWEFEMHCGQGACCIRLKKFTEAIVHYEQALTIAKQFGECASDWPNGGKGSTYCSDRVVVGSPYCGLGHCYLKLGQFFSAIELFEQALTSSKEVGDRAAQQTPYFGLGDCYRSLGQSTKAIDFYEQALSIAKEVGDRRGQMRSSFHKGLCCLCPLENGLNNDIWSDLSKIPELAKAIEHFEQALSIAQELGDQLHEWTIGMELGKCYQKNEQFGKAIEIYEPWRASLKIRGDRRGMASTSRNLGRCYTATARLKYKIGQIDKAIEQLQQARALYKDAVDCEGLEAVNGHLESCYTSLMQQHNHSSISPLLGRRVVINGLVAKPELNGRTGTALTFDEGKGRYSVELDKTCISFLIKSCNLLSTVCVVWLCVACFHMCMQYQGSFDAFILRQAGPEQTYKQHKDADRELKEEHQKNRQSNREPKATDGSEAARAGGSFASFRQLLDAATAGDAATVATLLSMPGAQAFTNYRCDDADGNTAQQSRGIWPSRSS
jgi:tetratricopeptide (TPR) repeat protein